MNWPSIYRICLRAYPRAFRDRFGREMESVFDQGLADATAANRYAIGAIADALWGATRERASVFNFRSAVVWLVCLSLGLEIGAITSGTDDPQGTILVILLSTGLIGAIWRRGALTLAVSLALGIPGMFAIFALSGKGPMEWPTFIALVPALIGLACGTGIRKVLEAADSAIVGSVVGALAGLLFGLTNLLLQTPAVLILCCALAGVGLGRSAPRRAYLSAGFLALCVLAVEFADMGMQVSSPGVIRLHAPSPNQLAVDFGIALLALAGAALGIRYQSDPGDQNRQEAT